jgi:transcriptional regulator with XRE-family HTH domain
MSQRELARRAGTAQSIVARIERGQANPTIGTLERLLESAGHELHLTAVPVPPADALVAAYKRDVDASLLRENLRRSVDERLTMNDEIQRVTSAMRDALRSKRGRS